MVKASDIKLIENDEKEEVLMDAIAKTIQITCMEYDITSQQIIGCLHTITTEHQALYHRKRNAG